MSNCATDVTGCTDEELAAGLAPLRETIQTLRELGLIPAERKPPPLSALQWAIINQMWERGMWGSDFQVCTLMRDHYGIKPFAKGAGRSATPEYKQWRRKYRAAHVAISRALSRLEQKNIVAAGKLTEEAHECLKEQRCRADS